MTEQDQHLRYFLILAHLLREADLQLEADIDQPATQLYADDLEALRDALGSAVDAAGSIIDRLQTQRTSPSAPVFDFAGTTRALTH